MRLNDLEYNYPPNAVALEPRRPSRVAFTAAHAGPEELTVAQLLGRFHADDLFVVNETKVNPARVFSAEEIEILFLKQIDPVTWEVLFPARDFKVGASMTLPGGVVASLVAKGLPQQLRVDRPLPPDYFAQYGEMALPPYIQEARGERHNRATDSAWYQSAWARQPGSVAAPTASLHFSAQDLGALNVAKITLHVGAGTFLPVRTDNLAEHTMHSERVEIPLEVAERVRAAKGQVWALGTTAARALESMEILARQGDKLVGDTKLFIYPPYEFKNVDVLLTNFHQPRSTLLALVAAFAGLDQVKRTYAWAIARGFQLFSYGDLSAWTR